MRKLVRDVKTVTKGVMVVTASAIGGELLFEAEPLDNSVYNKVSFIYVVKLCARYFISFEHYFSTCFSSFSRFFRS